MKMGIGGTQRNVRPPLNDALWSSRKRSRRFADASCEAVVLFGPVGESEPLHPASHTIPSSAIANRRMVALPGTK